MSTITRRTATSAKKRGVHPRRTAILLRKCEQRTLEPLAATPGRLLRGDEVDVSLPARISCCDVFRARKLGADVIETVVLSSNEDGLRFAHKHGFVEINRYLLPGDTIPWIDMRQA